MCERMVNSETVILLFSRLPEEEAIHKRLSIDGMENLKIWNTLDHHITKVASSTGLPYIKFNENFQQGNTFGERITNAISKVFLLGFTNIILVGGDCPDLNKSHFLTTRQAFLNGNEIIVGPDRRGGIYLLGISRNAFNKELFLKFDWQTRDLYTGIKAYALSFRHKFLSFLRDVNVLGDAIILNNEKFEKFSPFLLLTCTINIFFEGVFTYIKSLLPITNIALRAPPAISLL